MATKAIVVRRSARRSKFVIPLGIVAGFAPMVAPAIGAAVRQDFKLAQYYFAYNFTGYDITQRAWDAKALIRNWTPGLLGIGIHFLAQKMGVNRAIRRLIPFIEL